MAAGKRSQGLPPRLQRFLEQPDLQPLGRDIIVEIASGLPAAFAVPDAGRILVNPASMLSDQAMLVGLRHVLELATLLRLCPDRPALAGLVAGRTAGLFAAIEGEAGEFGGAETTVDDVLAAWPRLARYQPGVAEALPDDAGTALAELWPLLGPAEWLMQTGGDVRLRLDPATGLNGYGCSHRPRPWAVTFASSTASSSSERGYAGAEAARLRLLAAALTGTSGISDELEAIRRAIGLYYGLPAGSAVVLAASGTDCELLALVIAQMHGEGCAVTNILIAPEETGSGVPLAAAGRHFAIDTARGETVPRGELIVGLRDDTVVETVPLRTQDGSIRSAEDVSAECASKLREALGLGRRVLLHVLDVSKTGLLGPDPSSIAAIEAEARDQFDVVVDACQGRVAAERVKDYVERGWLTLVTGSKFFTASPFAGAVLLPPAMADRLTTSILPAGLCAYVGRAEWPDEARCATRLEPGGNLGLALRWNAALAEMRAFAEVGAETRRTVLSSFIERVRNAITVMPDLHLIDVPPLRRAPLADDWDTIGTILSVALRHPTDDRLLNPDEARQVYRWMNADLSPALDGLIAAEERALARRRFHLGQPVPLRDPGGLFAVIRLSAGARLVTGEPSHGHLSTPDRLDREVGDAAASLSKLSLILHHLDRLQAVDPNATFS